jgi:hypothetical protein
VCKKCGKSLFPYYLEKRAEYHRETCFGPRESRERHVDECFGLPRGGAIFALLIGAIIVLVGLMSLFGEYFRWNVSAWNAVWPLIVIVIGILIFAGAVYGLSRKD